MIKQKNNSNLEKISKIEYLGEIDTYDFVIPKTHCFFANNILVHNTSLFEIHADCVILLKWKYRDTNNLSDFNKYTIFISKNRDGATGYCELFFIPENYLFVDIAKEPIDNPKNPVNWQDEEE